ncbi:hypothetical protein ROZALSC1DRAFT_29458, partial [Rozella allomycis CSF55]
MTKHSSNHQFSSATSEFLNNLLLDSGISQRQKNVFKNILAEKEEKDDKIFRQRESMKIKSSPFEKDINADKLVKKRQLNEIVRSGAYSIEKYKPCENRRNLSLEKEKLQLAMATRKSKDDPIAFIESESKEDPMAELKAKTYLKCKEDLDEISMLTNEIQERRDWLCEMERLGQAEKYRKRIENEINE